MKKHVSSRFRSWPAAFLMVTALSACAAPSTRYYGGTEDEVAREADYQARYANEIGRDERRYSEGGDYSPKKRANLEKRVRRVAARVIPAGVALCGDVRGDVNECRFDVVLDPSQKGVNAFADGKRIVLSYDLVAFARDDRELAVTIGHEYAHNILQHVDAQQNNAMMGALLGMAVDQLAASQGLQTGDLFSQLGAGQGAMRHSRGFESEADYVGLYITARAGYDVNGASEFWRRMGAAFPDSIYTTSTHPTTAQRFVALRKTEDEISDKQRNGAPLVPEFKQ